MKVTRKDIRRIILEALNEADGFESAGWPTVPPDRGPDQVRFVHTRDKGTARVTGPTMAYDTDQYLPGLKKAMAPLQGFAREFAKTDFGRDTNLIRSEMASAMSSLNLVVDALEDAAVEYQKGPMGGRLRPRSQTVDPRTGEYIIKPSQASEDE